MRTTLLALLFLTSCSGAQVRQRGDGTYSVECGSRKACLDRADRICEHSGYSVVGGHSNKKRYGVPGNEKYIGKDEMFIRCDKDRPLDAPDLEQGSWRLKHEEEATPSRPQPAAATPVAKPPAEASVVSGTPAVTQSPAPANPSATICRPGETQRCVGPGACDGGQSCNADGSGFGSCDCGPQAQKPVNATLPATKLPK